MNVSLRSVRGSHALTVIVFFGFVKTVHGIFGAGLCKSAFHRTRTRTNTLSFLDHSRSAYAATSKQDSAVFGVGSFYGVIVRATVIAREDRHNVSKFVEFAHTPKGGNIH